MNNHDREGLASIREAASYLGMSELGVRRFVERGGIKAVRVGAKRVRLRWSDLISLAAGKPAYTLKSEENKSSDDLLELLEANISTMNEAVSDAKTIVEALKRGLR